MAAIAVVTIDQLPCSGVLPLLLLLLLPLLLLLVPPPLPPLSALEDLVVNVIVALGKHIGFCLITVRFRRYVIIHTLIYRKYGIQNSGRIYTKYLLHQANCRLLTNRNSIKPFKILTGHNPLTIRSEITIMSKGSGYRNLLFLVTNKIHKKTVSKIAGNTMIPYLI